MSAEIRRLLDVALIARARKTASTAGPNLYRSLCVLIERLCDEAERMEHKALMGAQPNNLIPPPGQEEPPAPPVMALVERVVSWRFVNRDWLRSVPVLDALLRDLEAALKAAPPVEHPAQDALRLVMDELRQVGDILRAKPEQSVIDAATETMLALDICEALRTAPPVEQERQELERLRAFVQDIANQKMCEDEGEDKKCHLDSGPYCGTHDYFVNDTITAARSLLA